MLLVRGTFKFLYDKGVVLPYICQKLIELYIVLFIYYVVYCYIAIGDLESK